MNAPIHPKKADILKTGTLPKIKGDYTLVLLTAAHIDHILALQDIVIDDLSEEEKSFFLKKDRNFFEKHFAADNIVLGVIHNGQLVAQSIILNPTAVNPKTGMVDMQLNVKADEITVIQGVAVHPEYRGNKIMSSMVDAWLSIAKEQGRTDAIAEVAVDNFYSWSVFLKEGIKIQSMGVDPADGTQVYNMHSNVDTLLQKRNILKSIFNRKSVRRNVECPRSDIQQQKELLLAGYQGVKFDSSKGQIIFRPRRKIPRPAKP